MNIRTNAVKKRWHFLLTFEDGSTREVSVLSESYHNAIYALPRFADVGKYRYEFLKSGDGVGKIK